MCPRKTTPVNEWLNIFHISQDERTHLSGLGNRYFALFQHPGKPNYLHVAINGKGKEREVQADADFDCGEENKWINLVVSQKLRNSDPIVG